MGVLAIGHGDKAQVVWVPKMHCKPRIYQCRAVDNNYYWWLGWSIPKFLAIIIVKTSYFHWSLNFNSVATSFHNKAPPNWKICLRPGYGYVTDLQDVIRWSANFVYCWVDICQSTIYMPIITAEVRSRPVWILWIFDRLVQLLSLWWNFKKWKLSFCHSIKKN